MRIAREYALSSYALSSVGIRLGADGLPRRPQARDRVGAVPRGVSGRPDVLGVDPDARDLVRADADFPGRETGSPASGSRSDPGSEPRPYRRSPQPARVLPLAPALTQSVQPPFGDSQRQATQTRNRQHHPAQFGQPLQASDGRITRVGGLAHIIQKLVPVIWAHRDAPVWIACFLAAPLLFNKTSTSATMSVSPPR